MTGNTPSVLSFTDALGDEYNTCWRQRPAASAGSLSNETSWCAGSKRGRGRASESQCPLQGHTTLNKPEPTEPQFPKLCQASPCSITLALELSSWMPRCACPHPSIPESDTESLVGFYEFLGRKDQRAKQTPHRSHFKCLISHFSIGLWPS